MNRVSSAVIGVGMLFAAATGVASADRDNGTDGFLCPVTGEGVLSAPGREDAGPYPGGGGTFLPGNSDAGSHANANALSGPPGPDNRPGAEGFTPLWNPAG